MPYAVWRQPTQQLGFEAKGGSAAALPPSPPPPPASAPGSCWIYDTTPPHPSTPLVNGRFDVSGRLSERCRRDLWLGDLPSFVHEVIITAVMTLPPAPPFFYLTVVIDKGWPHSGRGVLFECILSCYVRFLCRFSDPRALARQHPYAVLSSSSSSSFA
jgi:hypothetical protein